MSLNNQILAWWQRYWIIGLWLVTLLLGLSSYAYLARNIGHPFGGVDVSTPVWCGSGCQLMNNPYSIAK
jgi:hypothetical protein